MQIEKWKHFAWTYVEYPDGDVFGYLLAVSSLLPIALCVSFATLILFRRDLHTICFFAGQLINEILNRVIKNFIQEPRPVARDGLTSEFGMPSSHSQFMAFFSIYLLLFLFMRLPANIDFLNILYKIAIILSSFTATILVLYGRIYLGYHTTAQVTVGAMLGAIFGVFWFTVVHLVLTPYFPFIASLAISEHFLIRDTTNIPNVMYFEYLCLRNEANRRTKLDGKVNTNKMK